MKEKKKHMKENEEIVTEEKAEKNESLEQQASEEVSADETTKLKEENEELKKKCDENLNRFIRMQADFDNYKKRVAKEKDEMYQLAVEAAVKGLLPIVDNMERAVGAFRAEDLDEKYVSGVDMVYKQLVDFLDKSGVKEIPALNEEFDPNVHNAVMQTEANDDDENKVKEVFQKGYIIGTRVIRPSLVKVAIKN